MQNKEYISTIIRLTEAEDKDKNQEIESYSQLAKLLTDTELSDIELLLEKFRSLSFIEDDETLYNRLPMSVMYKQLPIVLNSDILVKVVILQQGEGLILVIPENVVEAHNDITENPELISEKNNNISLYAEVYNLDASDEKLHDIIKSAYIHAGSDLNPFELTGDLSTEMKKDEDQDEGELQDVPTDMGDFGDIPEDMDDIPDMDVNNEAYKKFKKQSNVLEKASRKLYNKSNSIFKDNVKKGFYKNVLVIEVNNKNIYRKYSKAPAVAKKLLTAFGESIKSIDSIQLVDTFSKDGKRYFIIAENLANNFWYVIKEDMDKLNDDQSYIDADRSSVIKMRKSAIRRESRRIIPYKKGRKIVFSGGIPK